MRRIRKICCMLLLALMVQVTVAAVLPPVQVQAAAKKGLVRKGKKVYFYKNGKKIKKKWKTAKDGGKNYRFYFGKDGTAYRAGASPFYNVKLFKIGKKKYGFDGKSHRVEKGIYVDSNSRIFVFGSKGVYDEAKTKKLRGELKPGKRSKDLFGKVSALLGKPASVVRSSSCNAWNDTDSFTDVVMRYQYYDVELVQNDRTGEYKLNNCFSK